MKLEPLGLVRMSRFPESVRLLVSASAPTQVALLLVSGR